MMSSEQGVGMLGPPRRVPVKGTAHLSGEDPRALGPLGDSDDSPRLAQIQDGSNSNGTSLGAPASVANVVTSSRQGLPPPGPAVPRLPSVARPQGALTSDISSLSVSPATGEESSPSAGALPSVGHPPSLERVGPARQDFGTQQASAPVWFTAYAEQQQAQLTLLRERAEQAELRQAELSRTVLLLSQTLDGMAATQRVPPALPLAPSMPEGKHGVHYAQAAVPRKQETRKGIHPSFKTEPPRESRGATSFGVTREAPSYGGDHRYMGLSGATHVTLAAAGHLSGRTRGRGGPGDEDPDPFTTYVHQEDSSDDDS